MEFLSADRCIHHQAGAGRYKDRHTRVIVGFCCSSGAHSYCCNLSGERVSFGHEYVEVSHVLEEDDFLEVFTAKRKAQRRLVHPAVSDHFALLKDFATAGCTAENKGTLDDFWVSSLPN